MHTLHEIEQEFTPFAYNPLDDLPDQFKKEREKEPTEDNEIPAGYDPLDDAPACFKMNNPQEFNDVVKLKEFQEASQPAVAPPVVLQTAAASSNKPPLPNPQHVTQPTNPQHSSSISALPTNSN